MNLKSISIFLVVFFLAIAAVSAADENITDDSLLTVSGDSEDLSVSIFVREYALCEANAS